jgi:hypothetical protein
LFAILVFTKSGMMMRTRQPFNLAGRLRYHHPLLPLPLGYGIARIQLIMMT